MRNVKHIDNGAHDDATAGVYEDSKSVYDAKIIPYSRG